MLALRRCARNAPCARALQRAAEADEVATFAAGCFWGVQYRFDALAGVRRTAVGYTGGHVERPTYEQVCRGDTGHFEACRVEFRGERMYEGLLEAFFEMHSYFQRDGQGVDIGPQYRSAIFVHSPEQEAAARAALPPGAATQVLPAAPFYEAEKYHQGYIKRRCGC